MNDWTEFKERFAQNNKIFMEKVDISEASDNTVSGSDGFLSVLFFVKI